MGPLTVPHSAVDDEKEAHGRAEELVIPREANEPRHLVLARNAEELVHRFPEIVATRSVRLPELIGVDGEVRRLAGRVFTEDPLRELRNFAALVSRDDY